MPTATRTPCHKLYRKVKFRYRNGKPTDLKCNVKHQIGEAKHRGKWLKALRRKDIHNNIQSEEKSGV